MSINSSIIYFLKRKVLPGYTVGKNALVIDIGSGDKPFWRANVFFRKSDILHDVLRENAINYIPLLYKINKPFVRVYWKNKIDYEIIDTNLKKFTSPSIEMVQNQKKQNHSIISLLSKKWYMTFIKSLRKIHSIDTQPSITFLLKK